MSRLAMAAAALLLPAAALAGGDVPSLAGRWPFEAASDPGFRRLVGETLAKKLEPLLENGPRSRSVDGRWVVVEGCRPHSCDVAAAFVVVDGETGSARVWRTTSGKAGVRAETPRSTDGAQLPRPVADMLDGWLSRLSARGR
jgi:hypothetical protein